MAPRLSQAAAIKALSPPGKRDVHLRVARPSQTRQPAEIWLLARSLASAHWRTKASVLGLGWGARRAWGHEGRVRELTRLALARRGGASESGCFFAHAARKPLARTARLARRRQVAGRLRARARRVGVGRSLRRDPGAQIGPARAAASRPARSCSLSHARWRPRASKAAREARR